jgi:hypothetical protein
MFGVRPDRRSAFYKALGKGLEAIFPIPISLSFWGGVWGIIFVLIEPYLVRSPGGYWVGAIIFGAIFPTAVAWFIVRPLKGLPVADVSGSLASLSGR